MNLKKFPPISINFHKYLLISVGTLIIILYSLFVFHNSARADITTGLVGYWNFDEGSGTTAADSSGNNNTGTLINGPTWTTGKISGALSFDGVNDYVNTGDMTSLEGSQNATWSFWMKASNFGYSNTISGKYDYNYAQGSWSIQTPMSSLGQAANNIALYLRSSPAYAIGFTTGTANFTAGSWYHIVFTYDGSQATDSQKLKLYVNGAAKNLSYYGTLPTTLSACDRNAFIGAQPSLSAGASNFFSGLIDEVRIYNRALTATEVQELYNYTGGGTPTPTPSGTPTPIPSSTPTPSPTPSPSGTPSPSPTPDTTPPVRSSGSPSGSLPAGTTQTTLSLSSNENATCKYSTVANIAYASITNILSTTGGTSHSITVTGLSNGNTYNYYIRCQDTSSNANPDDYAITFSVASPGGGNIINAASCNQADVQNAVNLAQNGDTVNVPAGAGSCTWSSNVTIHNKSINLMGPGRDNLTIIVQGLAIDMTAASGGANASRISGFTFDISSASGQPAWIRMWASDSGGGCPQNWRIDNNRVTKTTTNAQYCFYSTGNKNCNPYGLIDNNIFLRCRIAILGMLYGETGANNRWVEPLNIGGVDSIYVEDNQWIDPSWIGSFFDFIDENLGGRYVFRYNTGTNAWVETHSIQAINTRAARLWEVYRNTLTCTDSGKCVWPASFRGGTGVMFDNYISGYNNNIARIDNVRDSSSVGTWGLCDGTSQIDGNESGNTGYLCKDQIGASTDSLLWNFTTLPAPSQTKAPIYSWGNMHDSSIIWGFFSQNETHIQANRDYFNYNSSFNGTTGVGAGILAARPATCTTGVAYWATDQGNWNNSGSGSQGVLYKCTAPNTWILYYTPYTYPHSLRAGTPDTSPPAAPSGVTVN